MSSSNSFLSLAAFFKALLFFSESSAFFAKRAVWAFAGALADFFAGVLAIDVQAMAYDGGDARGAS